MKKVSIGKIVKIIFFVIAIPLLVIACTIMYKANKYPDKIPDVFGIKPMIVLSGSMETSIYTGDLVFVKMVDTDTLKENDVIAYRNEEDKVTTHRIIEIIVENGKTFYKTKGDNNSSVDANLVSTSDVEGIYVTRIAKLGNFLMFMQQPIGLAVVLLIILVVGLICLHIMNKLDDKKYQAKFEEFGEKMTKNMMSTLMLLTVGVHFISGTYARYTSTATGTGTATVAKWAVTINENDATVENATFNLAFIEVDNENVADGYIAPASKLYADFVIDPTGSQVAVDYSFTLEELTASSGDVPANLTITDVVVVDDDNSETAVPVTDEVYSGTIQLPKNDEGKQTALTANEAVSVRVYVEWENNETANATDTSVGIAAPTLTMKVNATVTQHN